MSRVSSDINGPAGLLPADVVFHPSWWHARAGIVFDEDFFYHPLKRVESERRMEQVLYDLFGEFGLGEDRDRDVPHIGAVHLAAGYLIQEMLGCKVEYAAGSPPLVIPAGMDLPEANTGAAFRSDAWHRLVSLRNELLSRFGYVRGDINWSGVLNIALDLAGETVLTGMYTDPPGTRQLFRNIAAVIERFTDEIQSLTGTSSISVNRNVRHFTEPVFLHSECTHTMISVERYEELLMETDIGWSQKFRPFGIHYCGRDPHRYAESFSRIPRLGFLDVGWGGDVALLRKHLPATFLNIRLDPVSINRMDDSLIEATIRRLAGESGDPWLTGICCINMDDQVEDEKVRTLFRTVAALRTEHRANNRKPNAVR